MVDRLQLLFPTWPVFQRGKKTPKHLDSRGRKDYTSQLISPQASPKRLWNVDKRVEGGSGCQPLCIHFLINYIPGTCSWGHRKAKRMLAFSKGGGGSSSSGQNWCCDFLTLPSQRCLVSFPSFTSQQPPAKPCSMPEPVPQSSLLLSYHTYLHLVTFLWGSALCPAGWLISQANPHSP